MFGINLKALKWGALALVVLSALGFYRWQLSERYNAGYAAAELAAKQETLAAVNQAVSEAKAEWELSQAAAMEAAQQEQQIVETIRYVYREIPKVEVRHECRDLGPDFLRVYNAAITAAENTGPSTP